MRPHSRGRRVSVVLLTLLALVAGGAAWWLQPVPLLAEANASAVSTAIVTFETAADGTLRWRPVGIEPEVGFVVYPGGKVPPIAYGPLAARIAEAGFVVIVVPMPLHLAVLGVGRAEPVIGSEPGIRIWAVGGHSLGGAMASAYVADHVDVAGLVLWAAYPTSDLSARELAVLSVWGSLDAGRSRMGGTEARASLPADAVFLELAGGNHEQMGWYTGQPNDPPATLPRADQQARVASATIALLAGLRGGS